jgi:hypothetical protein
LTNSKYFDKHDGANLEAWRGKEVKNMKLRKQILALVTVLALSSSMAFADEQKATVVKVDKDKREIVVKTKEGEKTFSYRSSTKGIEHAKDGAKVIIEYEKRKGGEMRATNVMAR